MRQSGSLVEFDIQNITGTATDADGFLLAQHDEDGEQGGPPLQVISPLGLLGCPMDPVVDQATGQPTPGQACSAFRVTQGSEGFSMPLADPREVNEMPLLRPGERLFYGGAGQFIRHHEDGSTSTVTTDAGGGQNGNTVATRQTPSSFERWAPWGQEFFDGMSYRLTHVGGGKFSIGYVSGLPGPFSGGNSFFRAQADIMEFNAGTVTIGPSDADIQPVAQATPLVAVLTALAAAIQAVQTAMATITTDTPGATAAASSESAVQAMASAVAGALEAISTQTGIG